MSATAHLRPLHAFTGSTYQPVILHRLHQPLRLLYAQHAVVMAILGLDWLKTVRPVLKVTCRFSTQHVHLYVRELICRNLRQLM